MQLKPYTVVLIYPDYAAHQYGEEFWTAHVMAADVEGAQHAAQLEAMEANGYDLLAGDEPDDWAPVFVCGGHHLNIART